MKISKAWFFGDDLYFFSGKKKYKVTYTRVQLVD